MGKIFIDVDTQIDFLVPAGALYVPGAERIIPTLARLNRFAIQHGIGLISTVDAHSEEDPEFANWPPHCILGTLGQRKPAETVLGQPVLQKQVLDIFAQGPELLETIRRLRGTEFVVYGVTIDYCVRMTAFGLLAAGLGPVTLVSDAMRGIRQADADATIREFVARGGRLVTSDEACRT